MFQILKTYGIPEEFVNVIGLMQEGIQARVFTLDGETELFNTMAGVLQGGKHAPYLFAVTLDYALRMAIGGKEEETGFKLHRRRSRRYFADDIAAISEEMDQVQIMLRNIELEGAKVGSKLNAKRTKIALFNPDVVDIKSKDGSNIKSVDNLKYLGGWMNIPEKDFKIRKAQA